MSAVSPQEGDQRIGRDMKEGEEDVEEMFARVFGESVEETLRETSEEANAARARTAEAAPSAKEVDEHDLDHSVLRSWCPHFVKGRADACESTREAPVVGIDYACASSE